jgi:hypothetical protein
VHRLLVIGAATLIALVLSGPAGAWTWPADGAVLRPFTLARMRTPRVSIAGSTSAARRGRPCGLPRPEP